MRYHSVYAVRFELSPTSFYTITLGQFFFISTNNLPVVQTVRGNLVPYQPLNKEQQAMSTQYPFFSITIDFEGELPWQCG